MVRISIEEQDDHVLLRVEGSLRGPWVAELERVWRTSTNDPKLVRVDLAGVSYVDDAGNALLTRMFHEGTQLSGSGPLMNAVVEAIADAGKHPACKGTSP